jgi:hypothetical protein
MKKAILLLCLWSAALSQAVAQGCSVCTKLADGLDDKSAKGLNGGIVYLALLPLAFMGTIGFMWWKNNRTGD